MSIIDKVRRADWRAECFWRLRDAQRWLIRSWYTPLCRLQARLMGVGLGRGVTFSGPTRLERFKHSAITIGEGTTFNAHTLCNQLCRSGNILQTMTDHAHIRIGRGCGFSSVCIKAEVGVTIGDGVMVGANTVIMDSDIHPEVLGTRAAEVRIGDGVFIGMDSRILKGVSIGEGAVVGAGSLVTRDVPPHAIAAGVPCRVIRIKDND